MELQKGVIYWSQALQLLLEPHSQQQVMEEIPSWPPGATQGAAGPPEPASSPHGDVSLPLPLYNLTGFGDDSVDLGPPVRFGRTEANVHLAVSSMPSHSPLNASGPWHL